MIKRVILVIILLSPAIIFAINTNLTGFQILNGGTADIETGGVGCYRVANATGSSIFVSTKTTAEWTNFRGNLPAGVTAPLCPWPR